MTTVVDQDIRLMAGEQRARTTMDSETYPPETPMDYSLVMHIDQPPSDIPKLQRPSAMMKVTCQTKNLQAPIDPR